MSAFDVAYLERSPGETRIALGRDGRVLEIHIFRDCRPTVGDIFAGRVVARAMEGQAAFIDIGAEDPGFLPLEDVPERICPAVGTLRLVQVTQEPRCGKGAKLTAKISLSGDALAYTPLMPGVALSSRLTRKTERQRLRVWAEGAGRADEGIVIRTRAFGLDEAALSAELSRHRFAWREVCEREARVSVPTRLSIRKHPLEVVLAGRDVAKILCSGPDALQPGEGVMGVSARAVTFWKGPERMFAAEGVDDALDEALSSRVVVPGGVTISIEETAALVAIDVDSGSFSPSEANRLAFSEIVRHIRLRALAGLILIDFAAPRQRAFETKKALMRALEQEFRNDPIPTQVLGVSASGLVEIRRDRLRPPLADMMLAPLPLREVSAETEALEVLRHALAPGAWTVGRPPVLDVSPAAGALLRGRLQGARQETERRLGQDLVIYEKSMGR